MNLPWGTKVIIFKAAVATSVAGVGGAFLGPHVDVPAIVAIWVGLVIALADDAGAAMSKDTALKIATTVAAGVALAMAGVKAGTTVFAWTGIGTVPAVVLNCGLNAAVTYVFGRAVAVTLRTPDRTKSVEMFARHVLFLVLCAFGVPAVDPGDPSSASEVL
jgi:uncharacterized protein (DUF697 family)